MSWKWFALMEMHLFVTMAMSMFRLELKDPMPQTVSQCVCVGGGAGSAHLFIARVIPPKHTHTEPPAFGRHTTSSDQLQSSLHQNLVPVLEHSQCTCVRV